MGLRRCSVGNIMWSRCRSFMRVGPARTAGVCQRWHLNLVRHSRLRVMLIDGMHIPLTVPFNRDGESYLRKLEYNVGRYSLTPAAGLVALVAEGAALSDDEVGD